MTPTGIMLIIGFLVILAVCIWIDKNSNKKFAQKIDEEYPQVEKLGAAWVTEKGEFSFYDKNGEVMRGEYLTPSRKPLKEKMYSSFYIGIGHIDEFVAFVKKYGPHIEHTVNGKIV